MQPEFWKQRWAEGQIDWHQHEVDRLLNKHWSSLEVASGATVLVPLCGKSLDMAWLASAGHPVMGVELSGLACATFFAEQGLEPTEHQHGAFTVMSAPDISLWCGDVFALEATNLADVAAVYDRAALIALPPELRQRYVDAVYGQLPARCAGLLITLEYPQSDKSGPPFSVDEREVRQLFEPAWTVELKDRHDILACEPRFAEAGVGSLHTVVYRLRKR